MFVPLRCRGARDLVERRVQRHRRAHQAATQGALLLLQVQLRPDPLPGDEPGAGAWDLQPPRAPRAPREGRPTVSCPLAQG